LGAGRQQPQYPIGTVAMYGPDDKTTVILHDGAEPIMKRWVATDVTTNPKVQQEMKDFFLQHGVKQVAMSQGNLGCPHEEGEDFPHGEDCPFCPFWKGKQGSNRRIDAHGQSEGQEFRHWLQAHSAGSSAAASGCP
jgi:hypothetical protein